MRNLKYLTARNTHSLSKYSSRSNYQKVGKNRGFTLVELLVVIAIIAILAAVVVLIINPLELTRRSRDAARLSDLANLQQAINVAAQEATSAGTGILCARGLTSGFCTQSTFPEITSGANATRVANGNGWVHVDLSSSRSVSVPTLPVDPNNTTALHYAYCSDGTSWEINAVLESQQQKDKMGTDGGDENDVAGGTAKYETGSRLDLINPSATCQY